MPAENTAAPAAAPTLDADIAAFIAEGHKPDLPLVPADQEEETEQTADEPEVATDEPVEDAEETEDEPAEKPKGKKDSDLVDVKALTAAVDAEDLPAFLKALGPAAEKLLTSKAHKALRLQSKELSKQTAAAEAAEQRAEGLASKLTERYADPMAVRKAVSEGKTEAVDMFIDHAEKTTGTDWNSIMRWVAKSLAGRPARIEAKAKASTEAAAKDTSDREAAVKQATDWVVAEVNKVNPEYLTDAPELADMVLDEIRQGYSSGVVNPVKALPLALKKLRAKHEALGKLLAKADKGKKKTTTPAPAPAARAGRAPTDPKTAPRSLGEDIADFMRENNLR